MINLKLMAIDGNSIVNRAFYGIRQLTASDGTPTNAVYGFLAILQRLINEEAPDCICVAFDMRAPTFRHEMYDKYKATRKGMPDDLAVQMPILKDALDAMKIPRIELEGWEADDLLGTLSEKCKEGGWECVVVTGDKDSFQLINEKTTVKHIKTKGGQTETKDYTPKVFADEYGFEPQKIIDLKALMGDSSDNIPGVPKVGEKTAMELVSKFGYVSDIYNNLDKLDIKDTLRERLREGRELAELSYKLAQIRTDAPIDFSPKENLRQKPDNDKLYELFTKLRFISFIDKWGLHTPSGTSAAKPAPATPEPFTVKTKAQTAELLSIARTCQYVCVHIDWFYFDTLCVVIPEYPEGKMPPAIYTFSKSATEDFDNALSRFLAGDIKKAGHDVKDIMRACFDRGIDTDGWVFDTALAAWLISPTDGSYGLSRISGYYCGFAPGASGGGDGQMSLLDDTGANHADEVFAVYLLKSELEARLKDMQLEKLFSGIELPLCRVLAQMEKAGFLVDKEALSQYGEKLSEKLSDLEAQIYEHAHERFNINSPKQLGVILFEKLMLPAPKKTKTGYSTNVEVLDSLLGKHPIIALLKDYRELSKLKSTYADGLLTVIGADGRIHTRFKMTATSTGRLSSSEPNLQNIPIRRELGGELRKMFVAPEGSVLVGADYSQIELRLLAHIAQDDVMLTAFKNDEDIHAVTASQVFGIPIDKLTPAERFRAKAVNFGIVYGISAFSLANDVGVTPKEAKAYIEGYLDKYSGVRRYMQEVIESGTQLGYVSTLYNRRRAMPELKSSNFNTRSFGERVARNMPIQGTAADIMKIAMINAARRLGKENLNARLIMQVHDELIAECPEGEADIVAKILHEEMENAAELSVPLVAETHIGKCWYDTK